MGEDSKACCCLTHQSRVVIFAWINVIVTGVQLILPLISTGSIVYYKIVGNELEANFVLKEGINGVFRRLPLLTFDKDEQIREVLLRNDMIWDPSLEYNLYLWASWLLLKLVVLIYSGVLLYGAKRVCRRLNTFIIIPGAGPTTLKKDYNYCLAWFALTLPLTLHALLTLGMDFGLGFMFRKPLRFQIFQYAQVVYSILGLLLVFCFLRKIHFLRGLRYREFQQETDVKFRDPSTLHL